MRKQSMERRIGKTMLARIITNKPTRTQSTYSYAVLLRRVFFCFFVSFIFCLFGRFVCLSVCFSFCNLLCAFRNGLLVQLYRNKTEYLSCGRIDILQSSNIRWIMYQLLITNYMIKSLIFLPDIIELFSYLWQRLSSILVITSFKWPYIFGIVCVAFKVEFESVVKCDTVFDEPNR